MRWSLLFIGILSISVAGCGLKSYSLMTGAAGKTIYVEDVKNKVNVATDANDYAHYRSFPPGLEKQLRSEIMDRLQTEGFLKVVNSKEEADYVLSTEITDYRREAVTIRDNNLIDDYRLVISGNAHFYKGSPQQDVAKVSFTTDSAYDLNQGLVRDGSSATQIMLSKAARQIADALLDQW